MQVYDDREFAESDFRLLNVEGMLPPTMMHERRVPVDQTIGKTTLMYMDEHQLPHVAELQRYFHCEDSVVFRALVVFGAFPYHLLKVEDLLQALYALMVPEDDNEASSSPSPLTDAEETAALDVVRAHNLQCFACLEDEPNMMPFALMVTGKVFVKGAELKENAQKRKAASLENLVKQARNTVVGLGVYACCKRHSQYICHVIVYLSISHININMKDSYVDDYLSKR